MLVRGVILALALSSVGSTCDALEGFWRRGASDGVNTVVGFAVAHGENVQYEVIEDRLDMETGLLGVRDAVRELGIKSNIVAATPAALSAGVPAIVPLHSDEYEGVLFCIVVSVREERVLLWLGGAAVFRWMESEEFMRRWGGQAILSQSPVLHARDRIAPAIAIALFGLITGAIYRSRRVMLSP